MSDLLQFGDARVDAEGVPLVEALSLNVPEVQRAGLSGDFSFLTRALSREVDVVSGEALISGVRLDEALSRGVVGYAPGDAELPKAATVRRFLELSASLLGLGHKHASLRVEHALSMLNLASAANLPLSTLSALQRRFLLLANACLSDPAVLVVEAPLSGVDGNLSGHVMKALNAAATGRKLLVIAPAEFAGGVHRSLFLSVEHLVLRLGPTRFLAGPPSELLPEAPCVLLTVLDRVPALKAELVRRGLSVRGVIPEDSPQKASQGRLLVQASAREVADEIVDAAASVRAPLLEFEPWFDQPGKQP